MKRRMLSFICCITLMFSMFAGLLQAPRSAHAAGSGDVMELNVTNGSGAASRYVYKRFSNKSYTFQTGDYIEYDVKLFNNIDGSGGLEIVNTDGSFFRSAAGWQDQNAVSGHPAADISAYGYNTWFHRILAVPSSMVGKTSSSWSLAAENDTASLSYKSQYDNIAVTNGSGVIRTNGTVFANSADYISSLGDTDNSGNIASSAISVVNIDSTNIALNKTATASASNSPGEGPSYGVNGNVLDHWCSTSASPNWLMVDLGQTYNITRWVVKHAGAGGETTLYNTKDFKLQISSDGTTFTDVDVVTGNTASITDRPVTTSGRYVRLYVTAGTQSGSDNFVRIPEFEVYGTASGTAANPSGYALELNVTNGAGVANKYMYKKFSNAGYIFQTGDFIEYDVKLFNNIDGSGGIEIYNTDGGYFRDTSGWQDQNTIGGHPGANISAYAYNQWFHRKLAVPSSMIGKTASHWDIAGENDTDSLSYKAQYDNIVVTDGSGNIRSGGTIFKDAADYNATGDVLNSGGIASSSLNAVNLNPAGLSPRVITPVNAAEDVVVASVVVTEAPYNADSSGVTDATTAIQNAINDVNAAGGGVVWIPAGKYKVSSSIYVKNHVTLRGDWRDPDSGSGSYGTVILANVASGTATDPGLFRIGGSAGVRGLTVYYPTQSATSPTAYPYTFEILGTLLNGNDHMSASVQNVTMLDSYRGISAGLQAIHEMHYIRNVKGTALSSALFLEDASDVGKVEKVTFNNSYWANMDASVSSTKPTRSQIDTWTRANGTGLELRGVEWHQMSDVSLFDYNVGIVINSGRRINYTGAMVGMDVENSNVALLVNALDSRVGAIISNSTFKANQGTNPVAVKITNNNGASILFNSSTIGGGASNAVQLLGNTMASFQNVTFDNWTGTYGLTANAGTLVVEGSAFSPTLSSTVKGINLQSGLSSAAILGNTYSAGGSSYLLDNTSTGDVKRQDTGYTFDKMSATGYTWRPNVPRPNNNNFYNVKQAPYNAAGVPTDANPTTDDTNAIQAALTAAGTAGGGTVYLPAGIYRINGHLSVPAGVELRGSDDVPHRAGIYGASTGTILYAYEGRGTSTPDTAAPLIMLNGTNSGVRGLSVDYPAQANDSPANIAAYPWTIKGSGDTVYAYDVTFVNTYKGLDFASAAQTNNHYVNQVNGFALKEGIRLGNATEGWVQDNLFNATHWARAVGLPNIVDEGTTMWSVAFAYSRANARAYVATAGLLNEHMLNNFVYGVNTGFTAESSANVTAMNIAADGSLNTVNVTGTGSNGAKLINVEGCGCGLGGTGLTVSGGMAKVYNMMTMESYNQAVNITGGTSMLQGASYHHNLASVTGGSINMNGVLFMDGGTHVTIGSGATANLWGNIGGGGAFSYSYQGGSSGAATNNIRR